MCPARANDGAKWLCSETGHAHSSRRDSSSEAQGKSTRAKRGLTQPWGPVSRFTSSPKGTALIPRVSFIQFQIMPATQFAEFILK